MKQVIWFFQFLLAVLVSLPFALLPDRLSLRLGECCGALLFYLWGDRRRIAVSNIAAAIGNNALVTKVSPESIAKENFRNLGKSIAEVVKISFGLGSGILGNIEILGREHFHKAQSRGKGVIFITGHCGNWELLGLGFSRLITPIHVVARHQNNPYLNRSVEKMREIFGNRTLYKKGALKKILRALKINEPVAILIDQSVVRSEGIITDFLGQKAYTMRMPAVLARKTGAPVLPFFIKRVAGGHIIEIGEEIGLDPSDDADAAIRKDTIRFSGHVEDYIRKNPSEWLWIHKKWKKAGDDWKRAGGVQ